MRKPKIFTTRMWGVAYRSFTNRNNTFIVGRSWDTSKPGYVGEPNRAMVFSTREDARRWCRKKKPSLRYGRLYIVRIIEEARTV